MNGLFYRLIQRFSEDIDIVVDRSTLGFTGGLDPEKAGTTSARKRLLEELKASCSRFIVTDVIPALEAGLRFASVDMPDQALIRMDESDPDRQTILVGYKGIVSKSLEAYVRPGVRIELGARSGNEPVIESDVVPFIDESFPDLAGPRHVRVRALDPRRTFLEKAILLHGLTMIP